MAKTITLKQIQKEADNEYQKVFKAAMKKFNISSPNELEDEKKKEFFDYVDSKWKAKNEAVYEVSLRKQQKIDFDKTITEENLVKWIKNYNHYGKFFYKENDDFIDAISDIGDMLSAASEHIVETESDWFDKIIPKKDAKRFSKYVKELEGIKNKSASLKKEATILFEEIGVILNRYYKIK